MLQKPERIRIVGTLQFGMYLDITTGVHHDKLSKFLTNFARFCQCKIPGFRCFFRKKSIDERALSSPRGTSWGGRGGGGGSTGQLPRRYPPNLSAKAGRYHPQTRGAPHAVGGGTTASRNRFHRLLDTIFSRRVVARVRRHAGDHRATDLEGTPQSRAQRPTSCRPTCAPPEPRQRGTPLGHPFDELQLKKRFCLSRSVTFLVEIAWVSLQLVSSR